MSFVIDTTHVRDSLIVGITAPVMIPLALFISYTNLTHILNLKSHQFPDKHSSSSTIGLVFIVTGYRTVP